MATTAVEAPSVADLRELASELIRRLEAIDEAKAAAVEQAARMAKLAENVQLARLHHVIPQEARGILEDLDPDHERIPGHVIGEVRDLLELIDMAERERGES